MSDEENTKARLLNELVELRQQIFAVRASTTNNRQNGDWQHILAEIVENMPDGIVVTNLDHRIIYVNSTIEKITGYARNELIGEYPTIFSTDANAEVIFQDINLQRSEEWCGEFLGNCKDGSPYIAELAIFPIKKNGVPIARAVIHRDITKRKQAEKELRLSAERFSKIFHANPNPMSISTIGDGRFLYINDVFEEILGYQRKEIIGRTSREISFWVNPEERPKMIRILKEQGSVRNLEICIRNKFGELRTGLLSAEIVTFDDEQFLLSIFNDITERKQFEREMALLDRLHQVGEMAASIGHEIRNPMTTIRGFLQLLGEKEEIKKHSGTFDLLIEELDRVNAIITEFLSLARHKDVEFEMKNINAIVETLLPLIQADAMKTDNLVNIELSQIPNVLLDEKEIRQLILNLVRNGLEAMTAKGNLFIRTFAAADGVVLAVQDQGRGIDPAILEKIGTPFFTTKDQGTGIGLAVCYSIAARHNAKIDIDTSSSGTTFFVRFKS